MIYTYKDKQPHIDAQAWVAESAEVIGQVILEKDASVFFQCVIRGDKDCIHIKQGANIQDHCTLHTDPAHQLIIEQHVSVGHGCILHGCHIEEESLIGMGAIILNGAHIGKHCIIGAGALVGEHMIIPDNSVAVGVPARVIKTITQKQLQSIQENALHYIALSKEYQAMKQTEKS